MRSIGSFALRVCTWTVLLGAVGLLVVAVALPRATGSTSYAVLTGSMQPSLPPGTLVVVRPTDTEALAVGDVVTYQLRPSEPTVVTHRVAEVLHRMDGEVRYRTQGDANSVADSALVRPEQVRGQVWYGLPWVGRLHDVLSQSTRGVATLVVAGSLALYAIGMFVSAGRDRRQPRTAGRHAAERTGTRSEARTDTRDRVTA